MQTLKPGSTGPDVRALQVAINDRSSSRLLPPVTVDGVYGEQTEQAAARVARALGALEATIAQPGTSVGEQRIIRWPATRTPAQLARARGRAKASPAPVAGTGPLIITATQLGLTFQRVFGDVGALTRTYGHYTAGPRSRNATALVATGRAVHAQHARQGWGGCSYGPMVADDGTLLLMNPIGRKAAGVAGHNTGSVHLNVPGTTGDRMTPAAEATLRWYVANAHTRRLPRAYRSPVDLRKLNGRVHRDDNATACPGDYTPAYRRVL
jgi:hypothetical protein